MTLIDRLNQTIKQAKNGSFYREKLKEIESISSLRDFQNLPTTNMKQLSENSAKFLSTSLSEVDKIVTLGTSGTTGKPKRIFFTKDELDTTITFFIKGLSPIIKKGDITLVMMPCEPTYSTGDLICKAVEGIGAKSLRVGFLSSFKETMPQLKNGDSIIGVPIQVLALARYCRHNNIDINLRGVLLSADYGSEDIYSEIGETFNCPVINHYGTTEMGFGGAVQCLKREGLHIRDADLYFEILDINTNQPVKIGEFGEIIFTTLSRKSHPFIRYRTGDYGRFLSRECSCGESGICLDIPQGRIDEVLSIQPYPNFYQLDDIVFRHKNVIDYTAEIGENQLEITVYLLEKPKGFSSDLQKEIQAKSLPRINVTAKEVNQWQSLYPAKRTWLKK